jgi:hypothetical protein
MREPTPGTTAEANFPGSEFRDQRDATVDRTTPVSKLPLQPQLPDPDEAFAEWTAASAALEEAQDRFGAACIALYLASRPEETP